MNFDDKLRTFLRPLPTNCQVYIKLSATANDMEACYHIARQWAHVIEDTRFRKNNGHGGKPSSSRTSMRQDRSRKRGILAPPPRTENPGDELDVLNRMATDKDQCFKCGKNGHFQSDCPRRDHDNHDKRRWRGGRRSFSARKPSFRAMNDSDDSFDSDDNGKEGHSYSKTPDGYAEDLYSDDDDDDDDYEYQERQLSFRAMEMKGSHSDSDSDNDSESDKDSDATRDNLYEVSMDGLEARTPKSTILPIYNAEIAGTTRKTIIDSSASTLYISQRAVEELGLQMTHVKARRIKVADHSRCTVNRITTVDVKVGNLPTETLTAYVFPLKDIDLVLGLSWLKKHNPHIDFRSKSYEFTYNGRHYTLHSARKPAKIRVVTPEDFRAFIHEDLDRTNIAYLLPMVDLDTASADNVRS